MNKKRTIRLALAAAVAVAVSVPLIAQVKKAQEQSREQAAQVAADETHASDQAPPQAAAPTTKPAEVDPAKVIVTKGDITVTAGEFNTVVSSLGPQYAAALADPSFKKRIADQIVEWKQLAAEARKRGLEDKLQVKQQIELQTDQVLSRALMNDMQGSDNEKEDRAYFDANKSSFDNLKARHILIRTAGSRVPLGPGKKDLTDAEAKAKAEQIEQQLAKGGDFAAIAKAESDDTGSGAQGGDLGTFPAWSMVRPFAQSALALKKNQISQPVKTEFGYHIIQLLDDQPRTFDEVKGEVAKARMNELMTAMNDKAKAEYDPTFFGEPAAPATQPAAAHLSAKQ